MNQPGNNRSVSDSAFRALATAIGISILILMGALVYGFISNLLISRELQTLLKEISVYEQPGKNPPSGERIRFLEAGIDQMNVYLEELRSRPFMKNTLAGKRTGDALALKESLYGVERKLRDRGGEAAVVWPKAFGFEELRSTLPTEEELPGLFYQIGILEEIGSAILKVGAVSVEKFEFRSNGGATPLGQAAVGRLEQRRRTVGPAKEPTTASPRNDGADISEFLLDVEFTAPYDRFAQLLDEICRLEHLVLISKLTVTPSEKNPAEIETQVQIRVVYV